MITDDNVRAAQIRTDALNGEPLEGTIQYPSQINTDTNCYSKSVNDQTWINLESIDVGNLHLAKYHSQTDNLEPVNLLCSRKENVNINDAKYPTDYDFKTKIDIKYNDDQSLTTNLVEIQNSEVNIIDEEVNVGDISPIQGTVQEQLAVNGFLEPATSQSGMTHGYAVQTIGSGVDAKDYIVFGFKLASGNHIIDDGSMIEQDENLVRRLYANYITGYIPMFKLTQDAHIDENHRTYVIGNVQNTSQEVLEVEPENNNVEPTANSELRLFKQLDNGNYVQVGNKGDVNPGFNFNNTSAFNVGEIKIEAKTKITDLIYRAYDTSISEDSGFVGRNSIKITNFTNIDFENFITPPSN